MNMTKQAPAIEATIMRDEGTGQANGIKLIFGGRTDLSVEVRAEELSAEIRGHAMIHGLKQKLVDAAAISRNTDTGASATIQDKYEAVREVAERLLAGEWNKRREAGTGSSGGLLRAALLRMYAGRMDEGQLDKWLEEKTDKEKAALRKNPKIAEIVEQIRMERAGTGASAASDDLLAELGSLVEGA